MLRETVFNLGQVNSAKIVWTKEYPGVGESLGETKRIYELAYFSVYGQVSGEPTEWGCPKWDCRVLAISRSYDFSYTLK